MADMLNSALSAIVSYQRALATTSHNIANVNTEGYSRQTVSFNTNAPQTFGFGAIGNGVAVTSIERQFDQFVLDQMRGSSTSYHQASAYTELASQVDGLLSDSETGISSALTSFFNSLQALSDDPSSLPLRQGVLAEAETLASRLGTVSEQFTRLDQEINTRMRASVEEINGVTAHIAELNETIASARGRSGGQPPNDLLDQRDQALFQLSSYMDINVVEQDGDSLNVFTGGGDALILDGRSFELSITKNEFTPNRLEVAIESAAGPLNISDRIGGGSLGGVLAFRDELMDPTLAKLGRMTQGLVAATNEQHRAGITLGGQVGGDFFQAGVPSVIASSNNSGSATVSVSIDDLDSLGLSNFELEYDGSSYQLLDAASGNSIAYSGSGSVADPIVAGGISIVTGGAPQAGDRFLIQPTAQIAGSLSVAITHPADIAAASSTRVTASLSNTGTAQIRSASVVDANDPQLLSGATVEFLDGVTYHVNGSGSFAYTPGSPIDVNGTRFTLDGSAQAGDSFSIVANTGGLGDNRNALALASIQTRGLFDGGNTSLEDSANGLLGDVAVATRASSIRANSQKALLEQNVARRESVSGVNLEEEAANMLRFQQAYQAAAQAVSTSNTIFQTLINAFR